MFRSAAAKLTLWYLALIMVVSGLFSVALYQVSMRQITENVRQQRSVLNRGPWPDTFDDRRHALNDYLDAELDSAQDRLVNWLLLLNSGMLLLGASVSYYLARRTLQPIQEAMELQGRFTSDASHELRTPLTAMRSEIEVALRDKQLSATDARGLLASNLEEIAKLESLSAGLLRLARSENGLDPSVIKATPATDIINDAAERFAAAVATAGVELELAPGHHGITGDKDSLVELVAILIDNAIKYSPSGGTVKATSSVSGHHVVITVSDEGMGIPEAARAHIFDRFYRADTSRARDSGEQPGGHGLGLSIAKRIVDLHHGTISVSSKPGRGSTFTVRLPAPAKQRTR